MPLRGGMAGLWQSSRCGCFAGVHLTHEYQQLSVRSPLLHPPVSRDILYVVGQPSDPVSMVVIFLVLSIPRGLRLGHAGKGRETHQTSPVSVRQENKMRV